MNLAIGRALLFMVALTEQVGITGGGDKPVDRAWSASEPWGPTDPFVAPWSTGASA
ncbi:hypothetical protein BH10CYA1_BH10CYA1_03640 [soil metagenome]